MSEEVEVKTNIASYNTKFNFNGDNIRAVVDLKKNLYTFDQSWMRTLWLNPYVTAEIPRDLSNPVFSIGVLAHKDLNLMENVF